MEGKAHRRQNYSPAGQRSRPEGDLSTCSRGPDSLIEKDPPPMLRRVASRGRAGMAKPPHVCVIGAGFAGLRCAEVLSEKGLKVTILEGRDRIGGRVYQDKHLGHLVDMGANWIHGTSSNPILDLANETNTIASSIGERSGTFDELGNPLDEEKAEKLSEIVWGIIADAFKFSNDSSSSTPPDRSLWDYFVERVDKTDLDQADRKIALQIAHMWGAFVGDPIERQSLKYFWLEECIDGENLFVASTYKAILDRVANNALAKATIHLSTYVKEIMSSNSLLRETPEPMKVVTNTETLEFDDVVITASLGCLKRHEPLLYPAFSTRISLAINNISYGHLEKVYITFPTAFWDPHPRGELGISSDQEPSDFPFFSHFLHPLYHPGNPHSWNIELVSLASVVPSEARHPTLLFYIHGPCAAHVTNLIHSIDRSAPEYYSQLNTFFQPYYSRLPNYSPNSKSCIPTGILATDWSHDRLAGYGSYTNFQVSEPVKDGDEEVELDKDIEALRQGMPERGIWLAGEHTAPFLALGTVTGAYWSGEAVARRIAQSYGFDADESDAKVEEHGKATVKIGKGAETLNGIILD